VSRTEGRSPVRSSSLAGPVCSSPTVPSILRIQAQGDYAEVHAASGVYLLHISLSELLERLDPHRFRRVHRSHVVNLDAVEHFRSNEDRRLRIVLRDGAEVVASRAMSEELRKLAR
jgi:two-component system LytT family response regulator